jgi:hypothetical protein
MKQDIAYFKFVNLPQQVKKANGFRSKKRLDCTKFCNPINYSGLDCLVNHRGMLYFYKDNSDNVVSANSKRQAEWSLTGRSTINGNSVNVTSLYNEDLDYPDLYYGYPNDSIKLNNGDRNPFYKYRHDGYLFLADKDIAELEMLIIPDSRNQIRSYFQMLIDGDFESNINKLRQQAQTYFDYGLAIVS